MSYPTHVNMALARLLWSGCRAIAYSKKIYKKYLEFNTVLFSAVFRDTINYSYIVMVRADTDLLLNAWLKTTNAQEKQQQWITGITVYQYANFNSWLKNSLTVFCWLCWVFNTRTCE